MALLLAEWKLYQCWDGGLSVGLETLVSPGLWGSSSVEPGGEIRWSPGTAGEPGLSWAPEWLGDMFHSGPRLIVGGGGSDSTRGDRTRPDHSVALATRTIRLQSRPADRGPRHSIALATAAPNHRVTLATTMPDHSVALATTPPGYSCPANRGPHGNAAPNHRVTLATHSPPAHSVTLPPLAAVGTGRNNSAYHRFTRDAVILLNRHLLAMAINRTGPVGFVRSEVPQLPPPAINANDIRTTPEHSQHAPSPDWWTGGYLVPLCVAGDLRRITGLPFVDLVNGLLRGLMEEEMVPARHGVSEGMLLSPWR
ncbi:hypothetical protein AAFF_G00183580 [Aldrovandia affinis]|uniref:Uncharacterized protein n=1 Tax=Aldrovandia affinis TaxID=143900 RepID=A0AAD7RKA0_9TELE|nr:hypothetical protein AAFF_G00183580 [Aldrovandia affinis]